MLTVAHLTASRFVGGPERQMLGLAKALAPDVETAFASFGEGGRCADFLAKTAEAGFDSYPLRHDTPRLLSAYAELRALLRRVGADLLCCHGYKAGLLGLLAARRLGLPVMAVSRGWTAENRKVRAYEALDRRCLRHMDAVACVSRAQARKVVAAGVSAGRVRVIHNSIDVSRFAALPQAPPVRDLFPSPPRFVVGAAGRLSPEKGFDVLIDAAARVVREVPEAGFVIFGDGALRDRLSAQIVSLGLSGRVVLAGFRGDLDALLAQLDLFVLSSHTEGLPNVILEAFAASVPVVATEVGGTPELIEDGITGHLVPPADPASLAAGIARVLTASEEARRELGHNGRRKVLDEFTFDAQAAAYRDLFCELTQPTRGRTPSGSSQSLSRRSDRP